MMGLQNTSWPFRDSMLPEESILRQESHPERTTQAVPFVLPYDVDLAIEDQVEIILSRLFGVTVDSVRISFDLDSPVLIVRDVQTRIRNRLVVGCNWAV